MTFRPCPKPQKKPKAARKPLRRSPMKRGTKRLKAKQHPMSAEDLARKKWIKGEPCEACGVIGVDWHHVKDGTVGPRHENHPRTIPLCSKRIGRLGCHWLYHNRKATFVRRYGSEEVMLARVDARYKRHLKLQERVC